MSTLSLLNEPPTSEARDWTFRGTNTRYFSHCYHDYPARMIPQIADRLIETYSPNGLRLFDPYCGTGSAMVEGLLHGMETFGTDLNPLARMLARAKTTYIDIKTLDVTLKRFLEYMSARDRKERELPPWLDEKRIEFWFRPKATQELLSIYSFVSHIEDKAVELFFLTAFSETIRECSNTRPGEFKLFRRPQADLAKFNPDAFRVMIGKLGRNREAYGQMHGFLGGKAPWKPAHVFDFDSVISVPPEAVPPESIDIVITSPPYGDSHTTVAYGQYSRLSSEWLAFPEAPKVDSMLMGGRRLRILPTFPSDSLNNALREIARQDRHRALEVAAFYMDLMSSIKNVAQTVRKGGFVCYVVANRRVKGVDLPTNGAVISFFEQCGFHHIATHRREIPNKRMPAKNSPSNERGATETTMVREIIVVMQR